MDIEVIVSGEVSRDKFTEIDFIEHGLVRVAKEPEACQQAADE